MGLDAMPIPAQLLTLLGTPLWGQAGTRDADLVPYVHLVWGLRTTANRAEVEVLLPNFAMGRLAENVADNGPFALTVSEPIAHATYQLKGPTLEVREPTAEERTFQQRWAEANVAHLRAVMPPHLLAKAEGMVHAPATYLRFRVEEIYDQTPGPAAGTRIPLED
jgi:hypothetical protein